MPFHRAYTIHTHIDVCYFEWVSQTEHICYVLLPEKVLSKQTGLVYPFKTSTEHSKYRLSILRIHAQIPHPIFL